jgi:lipopolysaccharide biosynthesis glycosyltransferase
MGSPTSSSVLDVTMVVVLAADEAFAMQLSVALHSLALTGERYQVFVLSDRMAAETQARVVAHLPREVTVTWVEVSRDAVTPGQHLRHGNLDSALPTASLFRLLAPELLPASCQRFVYLDADVLVEDSLQELWELDLGDHLLAAVGDPWISWLGAPSALPWEEMDLNPGAEYFNAGVLLVDVARWRAERTTARAVSILRSHKLRHADQCALNAVAAQRWRRLPPRWNLQTGHMHPNHNAWGLDGRAALAEAVANPAVVHFTNDEIGRPWQASCRHPRAARWFEVLERTPYAGWRPRAPGPARAMLRRMRAAARR